MGRRMSETAAHLVENVFRDVKVRQWVLTVPYELRFRMARSPGLCSAVLRIFVRCVGRWYKHRARKCGVRGNLKTGGVSVIQRFGSALALNVHFHTVMMDGVYRVDGHEAPRFIPVPAPSDQDVVAVGRSPDGRFAGADRILRDDLGLTGAAWLAVAPAQKALIELRLQNAGATVEEARSVRFVLSWETDANDVDFHIQDSRGGHAYYSSPILRSGGELYADVTTGYGPECFTVRGAPKASPYDCPPTTTAGVPWVMAWAALKQSNTMAGAIFVLTRGRSSS